MTTVRFEHIVRMERVAAWLRLAVVVLVGSEVFLAAGQPRPDWRGVAIWTAAFLYAAVVLHSEPYRCVSLIVWDVVSRLIDWILISAGILLTGATHSDLYLLYFLTVLSIALRYGSREVICAGVGTVIGYSALTVVTSDSWPPAWDVAAMRMGYLLLFATGSGLLAREARLQLRARIREEAQRLAVQEVTATVSHDLKTPLTAITGLTEILLDSTAERLSDEQRALLHRITANTQQMNELVSNLIDTGLIEHGRLSFRPAPVDLNTLVRRVVEAQGGQAEEKHLGLVLDLGSHLPAMSLDARMIERLVSNLLSNAVKFTPPGGAIRVSTRLHGSRATIEIWDSGPDVPAALRATLFDKFVRDAGSPGVGLGLYICRSVVEAHLGRIWVHTPASGGVTFVAELSCGHTGATVQNDAGSRQRVRADFTWQPGRRASVLVGH